MAGKRLDELADGRLTKILDDAWKELQEDVCFGRSAQIHPLNAEQLEFLTSEILRASAAITAWLADKY